MKRFSASFVLLALLVATLSGCPSRPDLLRGTLTVGGLTRAYHVRVPADYDADGPAPLVIVLHGFLQTGEVIARDTGMAELADREGFVAVFPDGWRRAWRYQQEDGDSPSFLRGVDDVAFLDALVDRLQADYDIDPERVYATGFSAGGFMVQRLALDRSDRYAAVAPVCANLPAELAEGAPEGEPVSVAFFAGTEDPAVPYEGGIVPMGPNRDFELLSAVDTARFWAERNGCAAMPDFVLLRDPAPDDGTRVEVGSYGPCAGGGDVVQYVVTGGGHAWPGGHAWYPERLVGRTSRDIEASEAIWAFFKDHPKPGP